MSEQCGLCGSEDALRPFTVTSSEARPDAEIVVCAACAPQLEEEATLDVNHWYCLHGAIWSEQVAVQVQSWRLLHLLSEAGEAWAQELLEQMYLDDEAMAWAREGVAAGADDALVVVDSNGNRLAEGDSVTLIKDLNVKGTSFTAKRGTMVRNIHLTDNPIHVEGRVNGTTIVLRTEFLKKA